MQVVILAAGKGSRMVPITDHTPKTLIRVGGKTILERIVEEFPPEIDEILIVIHHLAPVIEDFVSTHPLFCGRTKCVMQNFEHGTGTMSALCSVQDYLKNKFLVVSGDDIHGRSDLEGLISHPCSFGIQKKKMPGYHSIMFDAQNHLQGLRSQTEEELAGGSAWIATGAYVLDQRIFSCEPVRLKDGEYGLPQTIISMAKDVPVIVVPENSWISVNTHEDLARVDAMLSS